MKIRTGFVSNSSSASFVVNVAKLTTQELDILMKYPSSHGSGREWADGWRMELDKEEGVVHGFTSMDNDDLEDYLKENKIDVNIFDWEHD